ncbi:MAG: DUF58 domain-containing protein [Acidobacteria bacterium]|nr:DUF58 domain-containing protein [Acidobacteriota bacterium]
MRLAGPREAEFKVAAHTSAEFSYDLTPPNRGRYEFGKLAARCSFRGSDWSGARPNSISHQAVKVYPNIRRAREIELKALGAQSYLAINANRSAAARARIRIDARLRPGDEMRHLSWTATARRSKLITRQYPDRTRPDDHRRHRQRTLDDRADQRRNEVRHRDPRPLALMSAAARGGDSCGLMVFGRRVKVSPSEKGIEHIDAVLEALHDLEPELIEPSYARAFQFIASNTKKRAFVIILTDLVDKESSRELINSLSLLRPRHLPLVVTIGDRDLNATVSEVPVDLKRCSSNLRRRRSSTSEKRLCDTSRLSADSRST